MLYRVVECECKAAYSIFTCACVCSVMGWALSALADSLCCPGNSLTHFASGWSYFYRLEEENNGAQYLFFYSHLFYCDFCLVEMVVVIMNQIVARFHTKALLEKLDVCQMLLFVCVCFDSHLAMQGTLLHLKYSGSQHIRNQSGERTDRTRIYWCPLAFSWK